MELIFSNVGNVYVAEFKATGEEKEAFEKALEEKREGDDN